MLLTKLHIPQPPEGLVHRRNLDNKLDEGLNRKLILVSASAGYGKTTAIVDWISRNKLPTAWYSLDENDNDFKVFLSYIIKGLQTIDQSIGKEILELSSSSFGLSVESGTELLVEDLLRVKKDVLLILDDFHYIADREINKFLSYFLEYLPKNIHLVLITRSDPILKLSKLRSSRQLVELRSADLRFSARDVTEFFKRSFEVSLTSTDANELHIKTEGWISGIQLAGISMQSHEHISSFIDNLKGSNRYIMDYLIDEALSTLDASLKDFLLKTSILNRMCAELCDHMLVSKNSNELIEKLEKGNLFIIPLDNERKWYRYHHLFSELLNKRVKNTFPGIIEELHNRAGDWLINNDLYDEAIRHLILARHYKKAAELISGEMLKIWDDGNHYRFSPWLTSLPENIVNKIPQLIIVKAELAMVSWKIERAQELLNNAENVLLSIEKQQNQPLITLSERVLKNLKGRILINYSIIATFDNKTEDVLTYADRALELLAEDQVMLRNLAVINRGDAYFYDGKLSKAYEVQAEVVRSNQISNNPFLYLISGSYLATTLRHQGKLGEVTELCDKLFTYGIENGLQNATSIGWIQVQKGEVKAEFNDLDEAEKRAAQGVETAKKYKLVSGLLKCYLLLIRIYFSAKKFTEIDKVLEVIQSESSGHGNTRYNQNQIEAWKVRISISQQDTEEVNRWLNEYESQEDASFIYINESKHIAASRAYIASGKLKEAEDIIEHIEIEAKKYVRINTLIEIALLKTQLEHLRGETEKAKEYLWKAFSLAEPGGYIRTFVDEGPIIEEISKKLAKDSAYHSLPSGKEVSDKYVKKIIQAFEMDRKKQVHADGDLSKRELEILQLISQNLTNKEICGTLYISLPTVKSHISNILLKLEARNRNDAVEIAMRNGII